MARPFLFSVEWWMMIVSGMALVIMELAISRRGDWRRDALNAKLRRIHGPVMQHLNSNFDQGAPMKRSTTMHRIVFLTLSLMLAGCQTWGPTWSEVSGARYSMTTMYRYPAVISRIDDQGAFAQYPVKIEPGKRSVRLQGTLPGWPAGTFETIAIDAQPCKRYYLNAQYANPTNPNFTPVVDYVEDIAGCAVPPATAKG
jgi:hypothetical protein